LPFRGFFRRQSLPHWVFPLKVFPVMDSSFSVRLHS
jgi:hypothetical protein